MANIVELENLTKNFGGVRAVDNLSLQIKEGEFMTMLGPSGCGKTTTLRMIGGFEYPDRGRVYLDGQDVTDGYTTLFAAGEELKERFGSDFGKIPAGAIGMYS